MDDKTFKEMLGLNEDVTEDGILFLKKQYREMMNYDDEQELTPEDIERMKERMKIQKELFDRAKAQLDEIEDEFG